MKRAHKRYTVDIINENPNIWPCPCAHGHSLTLCTIKTASSIPSNPKINHWSLSKKVKSRANDVINNKSDYANLIITCHISHKRQFPLTPSYSTI